MRTLIIILFFSFKASAQTDTSSHVYVVLPQGFVTKYNNGKLKKPCCQFNAVQTKDGRWVTSVNAIGEFPQAMEEAKQTPSGIFNTVRLRVSDFPEAGTSTKTN